MRQLRSRGTCYSAGEAGAAFLNRLLSECRPRHRTEPIDFRLFRKVERDTPSVAVMSPPGRVYRCLAALPRQGLGGCWRVACTKRGSEHRTLRLEFHVRAKNIPSSGNVSTTEFLSFFRTSTCLSPATLQGAGLGARKRDLTPRERPARSSSSACRCLVSLLGCEERVSFRNNDLTRHSGFGSRCCADMFPRRW